jgi:hypothetical protein
VTRYLLTERGQADCPPRHGRRSRVLQIVVDENQLVWLNAGYLQVDPLTHLRENRRIRLHQLHAPRHDDIAKAPQHRVMLPCIRKSLGRPVGQPEQRHIGGLEFLHDRDALFQHARHHLVPALIERADQRFVIGKLRDQFIGGVDDRLAAVLADHPVHRADVSEKPAALRFVGDQFAVKVLGTPVDQHAAEIEHDCLDAHAPSEK